MSARLTELQSKMSKLVCGIMSGTSLDGIDVAIVHIENSGINTKATLTAFNTYPYPPLLREELAALQQSPDLGLLTRANMALGMHFAWAVKRLCDESGIALRRLDLIGSHGQTIHHAPEPQTCLGVSAHGTMQIGDPSVIAIETGIITVGDFRVADCAVGGHGAPLIPAVDYLLFRHDLVNRILVNIGGIANVSILQAGYTMNEVRGFDTGPGNMVIDAMCALFYDEAYDRDGKHALAGHVSKTLLDKLLSHVYFSLPTPKSTGRELFGAEFLEHVLALAPRLSHDDVIATVTALTAHSIADACRTAFPADHHVDEVIISGGGAHNPVIMDGLRRALPTAIIRTTTELGIPVDAKEAIGFALLANETIHEHPTNIPAVTGASRPVILGKICL